MSYNVGGTAAPGSDYTALAGTVTLPIGAASATILVTPLDDTLVESDETVAVTLTATAAYTVGSPASGSVTISSDDGVPPGTTVSLVGSSVYDNKTGKTYRPGGPDGADPLNDLNSRAEEYKLEIESGPTFWWEAFYADPAPGSRNPSRVVVTIEYRSEKDWAGTFTAEHRNGSAVLATVQLPVDSRPDPATGKGRKGVYQWDVSSAVTTTTALANGKVRFVNRSTNGKKLWVTYSMTTATLGGAQAASNTLPQLAVD